MHFSFTSAVFLSLEPLLVLKVSGQREADFHDHTRFFNEDLNKLIEEVDLDEFSLCLGDEAFYLLLQTIDGGDLIDLEDALSEASVGLIR